MAANINDKVSKVSTGVTRPVTTTVQSTRAVSGGSLSCGDLSGWATDTVVHFQTYRLNGEGKITPGSQSDWKGIVSGNTINNMTLTGGTDNGHQVGDYVVALPTAQWAHDIAEHALVSHNQDGTLKNNSVTTAAIADGAVTAAKTTGIWWEELARVSATSVQANLNSGTFTPKKYLRILVTGLASGGTYAYSLQFNGDTTANYSDVVVFNSAGTMKYTAAGPVSAIRASTLVLQSGTFQTTADITNISGWTKLVQATSVVEAVGLSAGYAPSIEYYSGKWLNYSSQITSIQLTKTGGTSGMATDSELIVLGHN